jgi:hypothetical protein
MLQLKITRVSGEEDTIKITPVIEFAFEQYAKKGFRKAFLEDEKQSDIYWLAWEALRRAGVAVKPFGADFLETLESVEVEAINSPNG